jgi:hypothetical protein
MSNDEYRDPWWARHPVIATALGIVVIALLCVGGYAAKVAWSPVKGAGDVIIQQNDADNMIGAQAELQERYQGLEAACTRIGIAKTAADADPGNRILAANYTGLRQQYVALVAEYNAMTQKLLAKNMLGDLPQRVQVDNCSGVN